MSEFIEWPRAWWGAATADFFLTPRSQRSQSPWTMRQNVYGPHVQFWQAHIVFPPLKDAELAAREAIIESLGGMSRLLRMGHPFRFEPLFNADVAKVIEPWSDGTLFSDGTGWLSGPLPPTIYVYQTAAARATSIVVAGLPESTLRALRRGDMIELRRNGVADRTPSLHRVTRDASSDSSGRTRIDIVPPLRKGVAATDMVVLNNPMTVFRLSSDDPTPARRNAAWHGALEISLVEALL